MQRDCPVLGRREGQLVQDERTWLAFEPPVVIHTATNGTLQGDAVYATPRMRDIEEARFTANGVPVRADDATLLRPRWRRPSRG